MTISAHNHTFSAARLSPFRRVRARTPALQCIVLIAVAIGMSGCGRSGEALSVIDGATMGTTWQIRHRTVAGSGNLKGAVDALLDDINQSLSTYIDTTVISEINSERDPLAWHAVDGHFEHVFRASRDIWRDTGGAFNPAVGPLVRAWGFGPEPRGDTLPDPGRIQALLAAADPEAFVFRPSPPAVQKQVPEAELDFSAIAKGYAVDAVGELLEAQGITDYMVEIGGEVRTRGQHPSGRRWHVGIEAPDDRMGGGSVQKVLSLGDRAMATSGSYRNYFEADGLRYAHILDPTTGFPETSGVMSVTVLASDSMTADAYATAFMVMGVDRSMALVESRQDLEAYFILAAADGSVREAWSRGFPALVRDPAG